MTKNESITIKPLMNGFIVEYGYKEITNPNASDSFDRYQWQEEQSMFKTWDEVVEFVRNKPLETPPAKIN